MNELQVISEFCMNQLWSEWITGGNHCQTQSAKLLFSTNKPKLRDKPKAMQTKEENMSTILKEFMRLALK